MSLLTRLFLSPQAQPGLGFTPRAQQLLALTRREAMRWHHREAGTLHLMLALLRSGNGAGFDALVRMGVDRAAMQWTLETQLTPGLSAVETRSIMYSAGFKKMLAFAGREARRLQHNHVGTEHLLLGLLRADPVPIGRALRSQSFEVEQLWEALCQVEIPRTATDGPKPADPPFDATLGEGI